MVSVKNTVSRARPVCFDQKVDSRFQEPPKDVFYYYQHVVRLHARSRVSSPKKGESGRVTLMLCVLARLVRFIFILDLFTAPRIHSKRQL